MIDYNALLQRHQNKLTEQRVLMQQWAGTVISQYRNLPDEVRQSLPPLPGESAQEMVPALFKETVTAQDEQDYIQQMAVLQQFVAACNQKIEEVNASEVVRCKLQ